MILVIESIVLCALFTIMVYVMSREPIKTLFNTISMFNLYNIKGDIDENFNN